MKNEKSTTSADPSPKPKKPGADATVERRLYRSRKNRVFKGVAGGIGEYYGIDPVLVRLAFLLAFAMGGVGVFAYILGWVLLPKRPKGQTVPATPRTNGLEVLHNRSLGVWILIAIGLAFFLDQFNLNIAGDRLWPLLLIGGGLIVLMRRRDAGANVAEPAMSAGVSTASARTAARSAGAESTMSIFDGGPSRRDLQAEALAELHDPVVDELDRAVAELRAERLGSTLADVTPPSSPRRGTRCRVRRERSLFRRLVIGFVAFLTLVTIIAGAIGIRLVSRGVGERNVAYSGPQSFSQTFGAGELRVDLTDLKATPRGSTRAEISMDFGQLTVMLPSGPIRPTVKVSTHGRIVAAQTGANGSGEATLFGSKSNFFEGCGGGTVDLDLTITAGEVQLLPDTTPCSTASILSETPSAPSLR